MKKHYRHHDACLNCGYTVDKNFCSNCGQENIEPKESFWHFVSHGISHYFHFDSKFLNSLVPLFTKPGYLTNEYIAGKRASHLAPLSMYLFISFVFFLILFGKTDHGANETSPEKASTSTKNTDGEKAGPYFKDAVKYRVITGVKTDSSYEAYAHRQSSLPAKDRDGFTERFFKKQAFKIIDNGGSAYWQELKKNLPKTLFILLPLFALILKLSFLRSKKYYLEHLIYSIHVHSFMFLLILFLTLIGRLFHSDVLSTISTWGGIFTIIWYIYRSMRTVYKNSRRRTVFKLAILSLAYSFLSLISTIIIGLFVLIMA